MVTLLVIHSASEGDDARNAVEILKLAPVPAEMVCLVEFSMYSDPMI